MLTKEEQKKEALRRMKALQLHKDVVDAFEKEGRLIYSGYGKGILSQVENEQWLSCIRAFEEKYNAIVFHIIHDVTDEYSLLTMLYVSQHKDEWTDEIKRGVAYVENLSKPHCSDVGSVQIQSTKYGGLKRTDIEMTEDMFLYYELGYYYMDQQKQILEQKKRKQEEQK